MQSPTDIRLLVVYLYFGLFEIAVFSLVKTLATVV